MLPKFYPIVDKAALDLRGIRVSCFVGELARAGVKMVQLRDKVGAEQDVLKSSKAMTDAFAGTDAVLIMNDRADLAVLAGWKAVHVGHADMTPCAARKVLGDEKHEGKGFVGVSTHCDEQVSAADQSCADYVAVGPVFATSSKDDAAAVVGLEGVRRARALTKKPIVAIGGITRENAKSVMDAGADCVAVIGGLFAPQERPGKVAAEFLALLG
jgi:thiamine-phosphate pyrophosphorylase